MRAFPLGSSHWWRRGLQHRRQGVRHLPSLLPCRASSAAISSLTTAETSSSRPAPPGFDMGRSRHGAQLAVDQPSSDTGGSIPSRPTARVTPDGATSTWPNGEGTGLRNRRVQVRPLPSTPTRRSSVDESTALRRRGSHVRVVPARRMSIRCDGTGILPHQQHPAGGEPAASRRGNSRHVSFQWVHGSQTTWSSSNGEDASMPRS